jgi:hypothetical protein
LAEGALQNVVHFCPDLARVVEAWPTLPAHAKRTMLSIVDAAADDPGNAQDAR